jgi:uncharacterized membrane protein YfcA
VKPEYVDTLGFGFLVWLVIYFMGFLIVLIPGYPASILTPSVLIPLTVLFALVTAAFAFFRFRKRQGISWSYALLIGYTWTGIAILLDYVFIVLLFNARTYYRLDVFLYYAITLIVPTGVAKFSSPPEYTYMRREFEQ